jgi:hypothetical protein
MEATKAWYKLTIEKIGTHESREKRINDVEGQFQTRYDSVPAPDQFGISLAQDRSPDGSINLYFSPEAMQLNELREYVKRLGAEACEESPNPNRLLWVRGDKQKYPFENLKPEGI